MPEFLIIDEGRKTELKDLEDKQLRGLADAYYSGWIGNKADPERQQVFRADAKNRFELITDMYEEVIHMSFDRFLQGPKNLNYDEMGKWVSEIGVIWKLFSSDSFRKLCEGTPLEPVVNQKYPQLELIEKWEKIKELGDLDRWIEENRPDVKKLHQQIKEQYQKREYSAEVLAYSDYRPGEKRLTRESLVGAFADVQEEYSDLTKRIAEANQTGDPEARKKLWKELLVDYKRELKHQYRDFLRGPKSKSSEDILQWVTDNYAAYQLLSAESSPQEELNVGELHPKEAAEASIALADMWTDIFRKKDLLNREEQVFTKEGTILWESDRTFFRKESVDAAFSRIEAADRRYADSRDLQRFTAAAQAEEASPSSRMIDQLKDYLKDLKDTDPVWRLWNSRGFRNLKTSLSKTIEALQEYRRHPVSEQLEKVTEQLEALSTCAQLYSNAKNGVYERTHDERDRRRSVIASKILGHTKNLLKASAQTRSELETIGTMKARIRTLDAVNDELRADAGKVPPEKCKNAIIDAVSSWKKIPPTHKKYEETKLSLENRLYYMISSTGAKDDKSFLATPEFAGIRTELTGLVKHARAVKHAEIESFNEEWNSKPHPRRMH